MGELPDGYALCPQCGVHAFKKGRNRQFCEGCSTQRHLERQRVWASTHPKPYDPAAAKTQREQRTALLVEAGAARNEPADIGWPATSYPDLGWIARVSMPFTYAMSKNAVWRSVGAGHVILGKESRTAREELRSRLEQALVGIHVVTARVWLDIMVEKPDHKGDAVNVVDLVADAVQDATGINDRWFSIRRLDWRVVKQDPRLFVGLGQETDAVESQVCAYCGRVLALEWFGANRSTKTGRARGCIDCTRAADRRRRERKATA